MAASPSATDPVTIRKSLRINELRNLKSDQDQRDGFVRNRVLETDKFPTAEFVPTKIDGLRKMISFTGQAGVQVTGNLTVHGMTKEVTFKGIATFNRYRTRQNYVQLRYLRPQQTHDSSSDER
jgi:polyisoprenoid-binding protein YceI